MSENELSKSQQEKLLKARQVLSQFDAVVVAFSAGVDSTLLLQLAVQTMADNCLAITATSASLAPWEKEQAIHLAQQMGARLQLVETNEIEREEYAQNPPDRCFYCKNELFEVLRKIAEESGGATLLYGANADDLRSDYRPGQRAAQEFGVRAPLAEANMSKQDIRDISRALGLETWNKPQLACLASRFPYGTRITADRLRQVAQAEMAVRQAGFFDVRVRYHQDIARIEVGEEELSRFADAALRESVARAVRETGFRYATLDLDGFTSGRLNDVLAGEHNES